jgi:BirA family biotin operon repressor/biotin-[acetyl-CoA-carboxylase] ligase
VEARAIGVLSLRLAIGLSPILEQWSDLPVTIKWPNDIFAGERKLAGLLVETRWRADTPEWVAVGVGVNLREPADLAAAALRPGSPPLGVLRELVAAIRSACAATGLLSPEELQLYASRDRARGRLARAPHRGTVAGVATDGALIIEMATGRRVAVHAGSLILEEDG